MFKKINNMTNPNLLGAIMAVMMGVGVQFGSMLAGGRINIFMGIGGAIAGFFVGRMAAKKNAAKQEKADQ